jgi:BirA family transcriptional regulator, biotin operon repressor / biotin---[acetyl-CoA-carboxylase] ligase
MPLTPRAGSGVLGGPLIHLDTTGSTNDHAHQLARAGAPHGTVVVAEHQTAGRGRQGRSWETARGRALTLSAVLRLPDPQLALLPLAAAVAVCEACEQLAAVEAQIKWPNDVWIDALKVAGILIEARPQEGWAVAGVGLNVNTRGEEFPSELRPIATSLAVAAGTAIPRDDVLDTLFGRLAARTGPRSAGVLDEYRRRDALRDQRVHWAGRSGVAAGIDERGNLVVFCDNGERVALDAGEVHLDGKPR